MSRKTEEIKKSLCHLEAIQKQILSLAEETKDSGLTLACDQMKSELENLKLWINMLYKYNGTSKSNAKITANRENGKKGGRPPKFVSDLKKQRAELEALLSDLHNQQISSTIEEEPQISGKAQKVKAELEDINSKLEQLGK